MKWRSRNQWSAAAAAAAAFAAGAFAGDVPAGWEKLSLVVGGAVMAAVAGVAGLQKKITFPAPTEIS